MRRKLFFATWLSLFVCIVWAQNSITKLEVCESMRRVADWQIAHFKEVRHTPVNWVNATFYLGLTKWAAIAEQVHNDRMYYDWLIGVGHHEHWQLDKRLYHADDICVGQAYLDLYRKFGQEEMYQPTLTRAKWVVAHPSKGSFKLNYGDNSTLERWTWCDALFMAPPVYARLYTITGDKKFLRFMNKEYKATYDYLYDKEVGLFYRDHRYFNEREANGQKVFWGRGNGWVVGGLVEILRELPQKNKSRKFYEELFVNLCTRVADCQQSDGFWRASLLDPDSYPSPETSSTGFFVYGLAYGINEGLLSKEQFMPVVEKGWKALLSVVEEDGKLGYVQPIGADPRKVSREMTEVYGPGAFLLAGSEIYRMASDSMGIRQFAEKDIREIAAMLPEKPQGLGLTYKNRAYWDKMRDSREGKQFVHAAALSMKDGMPPFVDSLYLHLNATGQRLPGEKMLKSRFYYLWQLSLAECMENEGRFIPAICEGIEAICRQKPWSIPAHDRDLHNYKGTNYDVDLVVATEGNAFAQCLYLLDDKLPIESRALAMCAFREKIFRPIYRCLENNKPFWWFTMTNNWNSVCLAGVTGAALALLPDRDARAYYVAAAQKYQGYGMTGYGNDGYCSEGVGYYNYGFGAYITLRETVCRATQGKIDFFRSPKFVSIAGYGKNIQIINGVCPAYSDCHVDATPESFITDYCARALGLDNMSDTNDRYTIPSMNNLSLRIIGMFPNKAWKVDMTPEMEQVLKTETDPLRTVYSEAGVFIARPQKESLCTMGISFKGGHNNENHNHNDVGSYIVVKGNEPIAGEMGGPYSYPGDFFGGKGYTYPIKNSFGHPVPKVDGKLQKDGSKAQGILIDKKLTDEIDSYKIDLTSAYATVTSLKQLTRQFTYDRGGKGRFIVEDRYAADTHIAFETALTTRATWKQVAPNQLELTSGKETVRVTVEASSPVIFKSDTVEVNCPPYTRIGIELKEKAATGNIKLIFE